MNKDQKLIEKLRTISVRTAPPWTEPLKDLKRTINNAEANEKIAEESQRLKAQWTRGNGKWARWERERKAAVMKNKPEWIKRGATAHDRDEAMKG